MQINLEISDIVMLSEALDLAIHYQERCVENNMPDSPFFFDSSSKRKIREECRTSIAKFERLKKKIGAED